MPIARNISILRNVVLTRNMLYVYRFAKSSSASRSNRRMVIYVAFTLQQLNLLCQYSYGVNRADVLTTNGQHQFTVSDAGSYWILDSQYDSKSGFEGMIAAPDQGNGQADYACITVIFAGLNFDDARNDMRTIASILHPMLRSSCEQLNQAQELVEHAIKLAHNHEYNKSSILLTGHSLGGCLALTCAIRDGMTAKTFCSLDPWPLLTQTERTNINSTIAEHQLTDYRLTKDRLTGPVNILLSGTANRSAKVVWCLQGKAPLYHWLGDFHFDTSGNIITEVKQSYQHIWLLIRQHARHFIHQIMSYVPHIPKRTFAHTTRTRKLLPANRTGKSSTR